MTNFDPSIISDTGRPRPVRIAAFLSGLAQAVLAVLALVFKLDPILVGTLTGVIAAATLGGGLFVEKVVTPLSSPAEERSDGRLVQLVPRSGTPD